MGPSGIHGKFVHVTPSVPVYLVITPLQVVKEKMVIINYKLLPVSAYQQDMNIHLSYYDFNKVQLSFLLEKKADQSHENKNEERPTICNLVCHVQHQLFQNFVSTSTHRAT